jgi:putative transposase
VNHKRVQRLCRDEGLRVRIQKRKRSRVGASTLPGDRQVAAFPNHVWALGFQFDQTRDTHILKLLNIIDEFTRTALAIEAERSISSDDMVCVLEHRWLFAWTTTPR